jgi:hypothetical protein
MTTTKWLAATAAHAGLAGQVNQFFYTHTAAWVYQGVLQASQTTGAAVYATTASEYLAESFTTGAAQTTLGQVYLQVSTVGGSPITATIAPLTLSLYADSLGSPTGTAIASTTVTEPYIYSSPFWVPIPLTASGLTPSTKYWLVTNPVGTGSAYYVWQHSNQVAGASTSTDGVTWTSQAYGLMYQVYDHTTTGGSVQFLYEDNGARWTQVSYTGTGLISQLTEYCTAQATANPFTSVRTFTYNGNYLTGVS